MQHRHVIRANNPHSYDVPMTDSTPSSSQPSATMLEHLRTFARECTALAQLTSDAPFLFKQMTTPQRSVC